MPGKLYSNTMENMMIDYDGVEMENAFLLVSTLLSQWWYSILYVAGAIFLGLHLHHAFWSAFQTLGWSNKPWRKRIEVIGDMYSLIIAVGFAFIAIFFLIKTCI